jgi:hypothetical protein
MAHGKAGNEKLTVCVSHFQLSMDHAVTLDGPVAAACGDLWRLVGVGMGGFRAGLGAPGEALGGSISLREPAFWGPQNPIFFPSRGGSNCPHPIVFRENGGFRGLFFSQTKCYFSL